jgi:hypothetical protein
LEDLGEENVVIFITIWNILRPFGIIYGRLVPIPSLWSFGIFSPFWYVCTKKNLATLAISNERFNKMYICSTICRFYKIKVQQYVVATNYFVTFDNLEFYNLVFDSETERVRT